MVLTLQLPIPQNGQTHASVLGHFVGLTINGLMAEKCSKNLVEKYFRGLVHKNGLNHVSSWSGNWTEKYKAQTKNA